MMIPSDKILPLLEHILDSGGYLPESWRKYCVGTVKDVIDQLEFEQRTKNMVAGIKSRGTRIRKQVKVEYAQWRRCWTLGWNAALRGDPCVPPKTSEERKKAWLNGFSAKGSLGDIGGDGQ